MSAWADRWRSRWMTVHANGVVVHGVSEPVLSVLDVRGVVLRDLFVIGFNANCGSIIVPSRERADEIKAALEPAYSVAVAFMGRDACWEAKYDRRELDGLLPSWLVRDVVMADGTVVMRDGRWVR